MIMFRTLDLRLQIARGRKLVAHATSRAGSYHQSRMIVGWQVARIVWRLTRRPRDWSCHLWNSSRLVVRYFTIRDDWLHDLEIGRATSRHLLAIYIEEDWFYNNIRHLRDIRMSKIYSWNYCPLSGLTKFAPNFMYFSGRTCKAITWFYVTDISICIDFKLDNMVLHDFISISLHL